jgi:hypothetical protein
MEFAEVLAQVHSEGIKEEIIYPKKLASITASAT